VKQKRRDNIGLSRRFFCFLGFSSLKYVYIHVHGLQMATKTITIDMEAYRRLRSAKRENESFSQTIKRVVPAPVPIEELIAAFRQAGTRLSESFYEGVEAAIDARKSNSGLERLNGMLGHYGFSGSARSRRKAKAAGRRGKAKAA
jgi:predicted CopG family antitoxin